MNVSSLVRVTEPITIPASMSNTHEKNMNMPRLILQHQCVFFLQATNPEATEVITANNDPINSTMKAAFL